MTEALLRTAEQAARVAGDFLRTLPVDCRYAIRQPARDVVLSADLEAERLVLDVLRQRSSYPTVSEEIAKTSPGRLPSGRFWCVDPLDGSMNYHLGLPLCCVSVGLLDGMEPVLGVVYDFERDVLYRGVAGSFADQDRIRIRVADVANPEDGVLCTGFPSATDFSTAGLARFVASVQRYRKVRLLGSAALSLAFVAAGRAHAYYERDIRLWDVAAGLALVSGAGGRFRLSPSNTPFAVTVEAGGTSLPALVAS